MPVPLIRWLTFIGSPPVCYVVIGIDGAFYGGADVFHVGPLYVQGTPSPLC